MDRGTFGIRKALGAASAVALTCACLTVGGSAQEPTASATKKPAAAKKTAHHKTASTASAASSSTHTSKSRSRKKKTVKVRGQQKIDSERSRSIQEALIREHYMSGEATGTWNQASEDAMRKYQADHGWQSKQVPDSRALIALGLGPSHDHLLNPESAMVTGPSAPSSQSIAPTSGTPAPVSSTAPPNPDSINAPEPQ